MMLRNLCCCSLRYSCMIIAITTICFYLIEMIAHGDDTVFMHEHEEVRKRWTLFLQSFILSIGIIVSLLLYYGSYKNRRSLVIPWIVVFVITFIIYLVLAIAETIKLSPSVWITVLQFVVLAIMLYFLLVVYSFCRELGSDPDSLHV
ncbi:uncharacterized protein LOC26530255 isoform X2 [Drosophila willistoni]|uniref:uncharacterized protein LOC26530255 isoform X2 n=1 Tax=Drosophila willistoni TaxID=7260 RepID=UPI000C26CF81|nr:uncharacterized protein LOC26530255 isoform X2 [Drosophila willistoni]